MLFVAAISGVGNWPSSLEHAVTVIVYLSMALVFFLTAAKLKQGRTFDIKKATTSLLLRAVLIYVILALCGFVTLFLASLFMRN